MNRSKPHGIALVLVLAFLALISVFIIGFFSSASGELSAASSYAANITTRQLADSATNLVMGQIREATTRVSPGVSNDMLLGRPQARASGGVFDAWASQPGAIRTFKGGPKASPDATAIYKLFSSNEMVIEGTAVANYFSKDEVPDGSSGWYNQPAVFTDLNEPISVPDPTNPAQNIDRYPILDPVSFGIGPNAANLKVAGADIVKDAILPENRQGRMPVRWLYILRDGSIAAPDATASAGGNTASFSPSTDKIAPTPENPVVGRIAFWADDDTCKVNINTAGGYSTFDHTNAILDNQYAGTYWDTPRIWSRFDRGNVNVINGKIGPNDYSLAISQPAGGEFQRYPGHPATTSLGLVFGNLLTTNQLYNLTPRIRASYIDTATGVTRGSNNGRNPSRPDRDKQIEPKYDRLYSSVDELLYTPGDDPPFPPQTAVSQRVRKLNSVDTNPANGLTPELIDRLRFFLTAHSRAPELNLFGRPRITIWPIWPVFGNSASYRKYMYNDTGQNIGSSLPLGGMSNANGVHTAADFRKLLNPSDKLIAFCSTIGKGLDDPQAKPYIFQRYDPYSTVNDALIPRNMQLIDMLDEFTSSPVPGYGGAFSDQKKYGSDSKQIVAEIFDYIRCINLRDSTRDKPPSFPDPGPPPSINGYPRNTNKYAPRGTVVPIVINNPNIGFDHVPGFGRFPLISEVAIDFYHAGYCGYKVSDPKKQQIYFYDRVGVKNNEYVVQARMIGCFLAIETFNPMQGYSTVDSFSLQTEAKGKKLFITHQIDGLDQFQMTAPSMAGVFQSFQMPASATNAYYNTSNDTWGGRGVAGYEGFLHTFYAGTGVNPSSGTPEAMIAKGNPASGTPPTYYYPFQSTPRGGGFPPSPAVMAGNPASGDPKDAPIVAKERIDPLTGATVPAANPPNGILVRDKDRTMDFKGGKIKITIRWAMTDEAINSYEMTFESNAVPWPLPTDNIWWGGPRGAGDGAPKAGQWDTGGFAQAGTNKSPPNPQAKDSAGYNMSPRDTQFFFGKRVDYSRAYAYDPYDQKTNTIDPFTRKNEKGNFFGRRWRQIIQPGDTVRSIIPANPGGSPGTKDAGDLRVIGLLGPTAAGTAQYWRPHPHYNPATPGQPIRRHAHNLRAANGSFYVTDFDSAYSASAEPEDPMFVLPAGSFPNSFPNTARPNVFKTDFGSIVALPAGVKYTNRTAANLPPTVTGVQRSDGQLADFDSGTGNVAVGPYTGKSDEGTFNWKWWDSNVVAYRYDIPYYYDHGNEASFDSYFSPNRQIPSAVVFGSLLSGRKKQWQTLAFSPNPAGLNHPGLAQDPKDHVLLDFFQMPIVEPYAISEPFSTAGKVNLNYPMVPFPHITRTTALRAVLQPVRLTAISTQMANKWKSDQSPDIITTNLRYRLNLDKTIRMFDLYFNSGAQEQIFRSASQICEQYLVPDDPAANPTLAIMQNFWNSKRLTGDNERERPYADIYPRITTKSNTYTVYMRVQTLRKRPLIGGTAAKQKQWHLEWNEGQDQVLAEYRGATTIERYLDPQDRRLIGTTAKPPEYDADRRSLEPIYRFRTLDSKRFQP